MSKNRTILCTRCNGTKQIVESPRDSLIKTIRFCPSCKGTGQIPWNRYTILPNIEEGAKELKMKFLVDFSANVYVTEEIEANSIEAAEIIAQEMIDNKNIGEHKLDLEWEFQIQDDIDDPTHEL